MEYISYVKIFNQIVDEFFLELIDIFPEETKIKVQYTLFQTLIKVNAKQPCIKFMTKCIPYLEKIATRDENFFKSENMPGILQSINIEKLWTDDLSPVTKMLFGDIYSLFLQLVLK